MDRETILQGAYGLISELWCSPQDVDTTEVRKDSERIISALSSVDAECAEALAGFLSENDIREEEYVDLFELEPKCSLYLGSHSFEEPKSCAGAGVSDRNKYMIDLGGVYGHFGRKITGTELPDYLPVMIDFLSITARSGDDPIRDKFITEYIMPYLSPMRKKLEELGTHYLLLFDAMEKLIRYDERTKPLTPKKEETYVG